LDVEDIHGDQEVVGGLLSEGLVEPVRLLHCNPPANHVL
jgi:hypothetical protein